jgi:hypothetical protein
LVSDLIAITITILEKSGFNHHSITFNLLMVQLQTEFFQFWQQSNFKDFAIDFLPNHMNIKENVI